MVRKVQWLGVAILLLSLCACGKSAHTEDSEDRVPSKPEAIEERDDVLTRESRDGFNESTNQVYSIENIAFSVPSYFGNGDEEIEEIKENFIRLYVDGNSTVMLMLQSRDISLDPQQKVGDSEWDSFISGFLNSFENSKLLDSRDIQIADFPGKTILFSANIENSEGTIYSIYGMASFAFNVEKGRVIMISLMQLDNEDYNYFPDYEKIVESATYVPVTSADSTPTSTPSDGIRPEFKQAMDSYEAFFDEYVAFMEEYQNSSNALAMITDYMDFLSRYAETMEALESMDTGDMSSEELAYYTEVMARINQKLLGAAS